MLDSSFEVLAVHDLCAEQVLLGGRTRFVKEAQVTIHRPQVFRLEGADFPAAFATKVDFPRWRYLRILFPFSLAKPSLGRHYVEAGYAVELDESNAIAVQLDLAATLPAGTASSALPGPLMLPSGLSDAKFRWDLAAPKDSPLYWGAHVPRAVLQLPLDTELLTGLITVRAVLADEDVSRVRVRQLEPQPFELGLADGEFRSVAL